MIRSHRNPWTRKSEAAIVFTCTLTTLSRVNFYDIANEHTKSIANARAIRNCTRMEEALTCLNEDRAFSIKSITQVFAIIDSKQVEKHMKMWRKNKNCGDFCLSHHHQHHCSHAISDKAMKRKTRYQNKRLNKHHKTITSYVRRSQSLLSKVTMRTRFVSTYLSFRYKQALFFADFAEHINQ